jgi:hypothetical protein
MSLTNGGWYKEENKQIPRKVSIEVALLRNQPPLIKLLKMHRSLEWPQTIRWPIFFLTYNKMGHKHFELLRIGKKFRFVLI